jgi:cystathionine beta-lyase
MSEEMRGVRAARTNGLGNRAPVTVDDLAKLRNRRSAKWRAFPGDILPLTVAEMDFALAPAIKQVLAEAVERSDTGYAAFGELGPALAAFAESRWGWQVDPDAVAMATDVSTACVELLHLLCRTDETVAISPPVYSPFFDWIAEAGARLLEAPLRQDGAGAWRLDLDALADAFASRPAAYILCNPHNPVGRVHTPDELAQVVRLAHTHGVVVISDEIHAPLTLPGASFTPFLSVAGAAEVGISLISASKAWNLAGLKCAGIVAASPTMRALVERRSADTKWRVGHFGTLATVMAFTAAVDWLDNLLASLDQRRRQLGELLRDELPDITWVPPEATYLAWLDCRAYGTGTQPRERFLREARVALEPGPDFGAQGSGWVRLNFGTSKRIIEEAARRMAAVRSSQDE